MSNRSLTRERLRLVLVYALACTFAFSGYVRATSHLNHTTVSADILSVQSVVANVLEARASADATDVNGDGEVNVLDLQRLIAGNAEAEVPEDDSPPDDEGDATVPVRTQSVPPLFLQTSRTLGLEVDENRNPPYSRDFESYPVKLPGVQRYLFNLMPNAPPRNRIVERFVFRFYVV